MSDEREVFKEESSLVFNKLFQGESSPVFLEDTRPVLLGKTGFLARQVLSVSVVTTATGGVSTNAFVEQEQKSVARTRNHDLPPIGNSDNLLEQPWPLLPGSSSSNSESRTNSGSSSWAEFRTTTKPFMFDGNQWPSLGEDRKKNSVRFLGGSPENEQRRINRVDSGVLVGNDASASCSYSLHLPREYDGGDIPEAPTQQKSKADDGENSLGLASGGKGWMRLPPLVMHSSSQQQQKRSRQAAFSTGESSEESLNSSNSAKVGDGGIRNSPFPPVYLMLNKDFVVISPLKENLLLTLALTGRKKPLGDLDGICEKSDGICGDGILRRQVFVGRFEAFSSFVRFGLGRDARRVVTEANAGGTSTISESLSVEYFVRKFQAKDVVTEMEVEYCAMNWKKVDYICTLYEQRVGISVTRAMSYPNPEDFSSQMAYRLLYKKLFGLVVARHGVTERHSFSQCILHVWCETTSTAELLQAQYKEVSEELDITDDVIMVLTVAEGWHARPIFYESCLETS